MDKIGDVKSSKELGKKHRGFYHFVACPSCGRTKWVRNDIVAVSHGYCVQCAVKSNKIAHLETVRNASNGTIKHASELGKVGRSLHKLVACTKCGKERWYKLSAKNPPNLCHECAMKKLDRHGRNNPQWRGGKGGSYDYNFVVLQPDSPFYCMASKTCHRVLEHRLIVAQHLGRPLEKWEIVHHRNNNKRDNRLENLELLPRSIDNYAYYKLDSQLVELKNRVIALEQENRLLKIRLGIQPCQSCTKPGNEPEECSETKCIAPTEKLGDDIVHPSMKIED